MRDSFRVCIVVPRGYKHSYAFLEVATLLLLTLRDMGYECDLKLNELASDRVNILLGYHLVSSPDVFNGVRYIPWQLEQLSDKEGVLSDRILNILAKAEQIWDYAVENIEFLRKKGLAARHLPVGYHSGLEKIPQQSKDIDVLFFGSINQRRRQMLQKIASRGIRLQTLFGVYGEERDMNIARSKIILNIHNYQAQVFEAVRVSYLLNNGCFILSESSPIYPYQSVDVALAGYDSLEKACMEWLSDENRIAERAAQTYEQFKRFYPMHELLSAIIHH